VNAALSANGVGDAALSANGVGTLRSANGVGDYAMHPTSPFRVDFFSVHPERSRRPESKGRHRGERGDTGASTPRLAPLRSARTEWWTLRSARTEWWTLRSARTEWWTLRSARTVSGTLRSANGLGTLRCTPRHLSVSTFFSLFTLSAGRRPESKGRHRGERGDAGASTPRLAPLRSARTEWWTLRSA